MPLVVLKMLEGRSLDQKRELARALTDAVVKYAGTTEDQVSVVIEDYSKENWAKGGTLVCDK